LNAGVAFGRVSWMEKLLRDMMQKDSLVFSFAHFVPVVLWEKIITLVLWFAN